MTINQFDINSVGQMTTPHDSPRLGGLGRPAKPRVLLLQELKATRMERVRLHRLQGTVIGATASRARPQPIPAPAPAQPRLDPSPRV